MGAAWGVGLLSVSRGGELETAVDPGEPDEVPEEEVPGAGGEVSLPVVTGAF